jgi:hypothetical protein
MIADCDCGARFWAEPPLTCCPRCDEPELVRFRDEPVDTFLARVRMYHLTRAQIRALPEVRPRA